MSHGTKVICCEHLLPHISKDTRLNTIWIHTDIETSGALFNTFRTWDRQITPTIYQNCQPKCFMLGTFRYFWFSSNADWEIGLQSYLKCKYLLDKCSTNPVKANEAVEVSSGPNLVLFVLTFINSQTWNCLEI